MKETGKKGTTLAEMCVVLALVAIISVMVISFSLMVGQRISLSTARLEAVDDVDRLQTVTESWFDHMAMMRAKLSVERDPDNGEAIIRAYEYPTAFLTFHEGVITGTLPSGEVLTAATSDRVVGVEFELMQDVVNKNCLCFCTVIYNLPHYGGEGESQYQPIFCVNPHLGDTYDVAVYPDHNDEEPEEGEGTPDAGEEGGAE